MAPRMSMKGFYWILAIVALAGGGWLLGSLRSGQRAPTPEPLSAAAVQAAARFPGYVMGSDSAPIEVTEYADFQCPHCAEFAVLTLPDIEQRLVATGKVRWRFRDRPLSQNAATLGAHEAAACAGEQEKFWEMANQLFYNQSQWALDRNPQRYFEKYAEAIGLDIGRYDDCMSTGRYRARIQASAQLADSAGIQSTPTFVIDGTRLSGAIAYDPFKAIVDSIAAARRVQ